MRMSRKLYANHTKAVLFTTFSVIKFNVYSLSRYTAGAKGFLTVFTQHNGIYICRLCRFWDEYSKLPDRICALLYAIAFREVISYNWRLFWWSKITDHKFWYFDLTLICWEVSSSRLFTRKELNILHVEKQSLVKQVT